VSRGGGVGVDSNDYNKRTIKGVSFNPVEHTKQQRYDCKKYIIVLGERGRDIHYELNISYKY